MIQLTPDQTAGMRYWFQPERQHFIGMHMLNTGIGVCYVDRWPEPRAVLVTIGMLCSLSGEPGALTSDDIRNHMAGMAHAPSEFLPLLKTVFPNINAMDRVVLEQHDDPPQSPPPGVAFRRLEAADAHHLDDLQPDLRWISSTWGGSSGLASSGYAWGAFIDDRLVSLANTFLLGDGLEDIGVVTETDYRGRGLAVHCASALCRDVKQRGRTASWTTSYDNPASIRVAEKLGFKVHHPDKLYGLGQPVSP